MARSRTCTSSSRYGIARQSLKSFETLSGLAALSDQQNPIAGYNNLTLKQRKTSKHKKKIT